MKKSILAAMALILIIAVVTAFYLWEQGKERGKKALKILPDHVDMQVRDVLYTDVSEDGSKWEIKAKTVTYGRKDNIALFDQVAVKMVLANGRIYNMTGKRGRFWTDKKDMDIQDDVLILSDQGDRVMTEKLHYSDRDKTIVADSEVMLENETMRLKGMGMKISLNKRHIEIMSHVNALIKSKR